MSTRPWLRSRYSSSAYSRGRRSIAFPARSARRLSRSSERSPSESRVGSALPGRSPDERLQTGQQLRKRERLRQVVVAARLQTLDAVVNRPARAQDEHGGMDAARADAIDERQPVETRQHHVDDRGVVASADRQLDAPFTVGRDIDGMTGFGQALADEVGDRRVVFDHEHSHDTASVRHVRKECRARELDEPCHARREPDVEAGGTRSTELPVERIVDPAADRV